MSYQDGRRVEALEAAMGELQKLIDILDDMQRRDVEIRARLDRLEARLAERPALARRHA